MSDLSNFTDKEFRARIHDGKEEIDEYIKSIAQGVGGYANSHIAAHEQGIPVSLTDVPTNAKEVADLSARLVYIDQRTIINKLLKKVGMLTGVLGDFMDQEKIQDLIDDMEFKDGNKQIKQ